MCKSDPVLRRKKVRGQHVYSQHPGDRAAPQEGRRWASHHRAPPSRVSALAPPVGNCDPSVAVVLLLHFIEGEIREAPCKPAVRCERPAWELQSCPGFRGLCKSVIHPAMGLSSQARLREITGFSCLKHIHWSESLVCPLISHLYLRRSHETPCCLCCTGTSRLWRMKCKVVPLFLMIFKGYQVFACTTGELGKNG